MKRVLDPLDPNEDLLMVTSEEWNELKALRKVAKAAWDFKMAVYMARMPDGELVVEYLRRTTANIRAGFPELQFGPAHERLVAALGELNERV